VLKISIDLRFRLGFSESSKSFYFHGIVLVTVFSLFLYLSWLERGVGIKDSFFLDAEKVDHTDFRSNFCLGWSSAIACLGGEMNLKSMFSREDFSPSISSLII